MRKFGKLLKELRNRAHLTQLELANKVGIDPSYVSKLERGADPPAREKVLAIAEALDLTKTEQVYFLLAAGCASGEDLEELGGKGAGEEQQSIFHPFGVGAFYFPQPDQLEEETIVEEVRRLIHKPELSQEQRIECVEMIRSFLSWLEFRLKMD